MDNELSSLENDILSEIAKIYAETRPFLKEQIFNLKAKSCEYFRLDIYKDFQLKESKCMR